MSETIRNVIIVGSGPAGLTAAIYAARANLAPLCIEGFQVGGSPGGQLMITTTVENYPGFPEGVMGPDLMAKWREQAARFGTDFITADADAIDLSKRPFEVSADGETHRAHTLILATGAKAKWLGLDSEHLLENHGVSACATCDGFFFKGQEVAIVGGGDTAMEEALYLAGLASKVTLIHRRQEFRASKIMVERVKSHPKIELLLDSVITEVLDVTKKKVTGVRVKSVVSGAEHVLPVQGLFVAIGHEPNTQLVKGVLDTDEQGYLVTKAGTTQTNVEGVWAAGDVQDRVYRQAVTAAGSGCMAAIEVERWLTMRGLH